MKGKPLRLLTVKGRIPSNLGNSYRPEKGTIISHISAQAVHLPANQQLIEVDQMLFIDPHMLLS